MYDNPLQPRDKWPDHLDNKLKKYLGESFVIKNALTNDELDEITTNVFKDIKGFRTFTGGTLIWSRLTHGTLDLIWDIVYNKLKDKLSWIDQKNTCLHSNEEFCNSHIISGNGYITSTNYNLHYDSQEPDDFYNLGLFSVKAFIIPFFTCLGIASKHESTFITFKNRLFGWETNFSGNTTKGKVYGKRKQQNVIDYDSLPWINDKGDPFEYDINKWHISWDDYNAYLKHLPKETYTGMVIENVLPYRANDIMVFDTYQLHTTGYNKHSITNLKGGARFNIRKRVEDL
tara:strand:+ start:23 stop:883 length:861 start_codon:yes stop_codon:yes gene_type:complete